MEAGCEAGTAREPGCILTAVHPRWVCCMGGPPRVLMALCRPSQTPYSLQPIAAVHGILPFASGAAVTYTPAAAAPTRPAVASTPPFSINLEECLVPPASYSLPRIDSHSSYLSLLSYSSEPSPFSSLFAQCVACTVLGWVPACPEQSGGRRAHTQAAHAGELFSPPRRWHGPPAHVMTSARSVFAHPYLRYVLPPYLETPDLSFVAVHAVRQCSCTHPPRDVAHTAPVIPLIQPPRLHTA